MTDFYTNGHWSQWQDSQWTRSHGPGAKSTADDVDMLKVLNNSKVQPNGEASPNSSYHDPVYDIPGQIVESNTFKQFARVNTATKKAEQTGQLAKPELRPEPRAAPNKIRIDKKRPLNELPTSAAKHQKVEVTTTPPPAPEPLPAPAPVVKTATVKTPTPEATPKPTLPVTAKPKPPVPALKPAPTVTKTKKKVEEDEEDIPPTEQLDSEEDESGDEEEEEEEEDDGEDSMIDDDADEDDGDEEPEDGIDLEAESDDDDSDEDDELSEARPLPPVNLSYEQRNAAEIQRVQATAEAKEKGGKRKRKPAKPKIIHIMATAENTTLKQGLIDAPAPKKPPAEKLDKALLAELRARSAANRKVTPAMLILSDRDLDRYDEALKNKFRKIWEAAVDLALDAKFRPTGSRPTMDPEFAVEFESQYLELAKTVVYAKKPKDPALQSYHQAFWAYRDIDITVPDGPVATSRCKIVLSDPMENQTLFTANSATIEFYYRALGSFAAMRYAVRPWVYCKSRAAGLVEDIMNKNARINRDQLVKQLKHWQHNGLPQMVRWLNMMVLSRWDLIN